MYINPTDFEKSIAWLDIERVLADITSEAESYSALEKRQFGYGGYGYYNRNSAWGSYGRWILLGVLVGLAVLFWLIICGCNRRRTRTGNAPVKYTGWATPGFSHPQQTGVASTQPYGAPNPQYPMQQYPNAGYQQPQQEYQQGYQPNQGYGQTTNNTAYGNTGYNEYSGNAPPTYPAQTPAYPANVASTREK